MRAAKGENKSGFGDSGSDSGGNMRQLPLIQQLLNSNEVQMPMQHLMSRTIWVSQQSLAIHKLLHTNLEDTARKSSIQAAMREIHMENRKKNIEWWLFGFHFQANDVTENVTLLPFSWWRNHAESQHRNHLHNPLGSTRHALQVLGIARRLLFQGSEDVWR